MHLARVHCSASSHFNPKGKTMTATIDRFQLQSFEVLATLKATLKMAQNNFNKYPNATRWNVQTREAFVYQQAFYFFGAVSRTEEDRQALLLALTHEPNGNWGDVICKHSLGMTLLGALKEHANCP
jgi:hypothetical protein